MSHEKGDGLALVLAYHVTPIESLMSIFQQGLIPAIGPRSAALGEGAPRVYLFPSRADCEAGLAGWLGDEFDCDEVQLAILEIDITGVQLESDVGWEIAATELILPERVVSVMDESWMAITSLQCELSMRSTRAPRGPSN